MTEQKKKEIRRLEKLHGVKVGERIRLRVQSTLRDEEVDSGGVHEIRGKVYQVYEQFVVIKTNFGTHPSFPWIDFEKWRVWYLGKALELLAQADVFIGVDARDFSGCRIENKVADAYGIKRYSINPACIIEDYQAYLRRLSLGNKKMCEVPVNE